MLGQITLHELDPGHAEELYGVIEDNRQWLQNLAWAQAATLESTLWYLANPNPGEIRRGIRVDNILVGICSLQDYSTNHVIGYWLAQPFRSIGIMSCAVGLLLEMATKPVTARVRDANIASRKVLEKHGFEQGAFEVDDTRGWPEVWVNYCLATPPCRAINPPSY